MHNITLHNIPYASYAFNYVNPYIKKDDGTSYIKALRSRYEKVAMQAQYVSEAYLKVEITQYINQGAMTFKKVFIKLIKYVDELEKRDRGVNNADIVEIIWKRVINSELSQYLTDLKVYFQHQPRNYREVLQNIASQVPSIGFETLRKASEQSAQGAESGGAPDQGIYDSNGLLFHDK